MKRKVFLILAPVLILALLAGCAGGQGAKPTPTPSDLRPNPDGTLGNLRWGMTWEEARAADSRIVFPEDAAPRGKNHVLDERPDVLIPEGEFFGHTAKLELGFGYFGEEEQPRLVSIRVHLFLEDGEPDYIVLVGDCIDPGNRDAGTWTSPVTLEDAVDREALEEFYPNWSGEYLEDRLAQPLWIVVVESLNGPSDVFGFETVTTGKREFTYAAAGQYQVLAQLLTGEK